MNGAESLVRTLLLNGIDTCFANPGTSELHVVEALDKSAGVRCVLGLSEGVVTGCADGYGRVTGRPAMTLLHCAAGLANGLANLHNARRAHTPVVNVVGDAATYHRPLDTALTGDTEGWARGVSAWVRTASGVPTLGSDASAAVQAATIAPGQIATLIVPSDLAWSADGTTGAKLSLPPRSAVAPHVIKEIAAVLRRGEPAMIILGGPSLRGEPMAVAHRIAAGSNAKLVAHDFNARMERGGDRLPLARLPLPYDDAAKMLAGIKHLILVCATEPASFFAHPAKPSHPYASDTAIHVLARLEQDPADALSRLADELGAPPVAIPQASPLPPPPSGPLTLDAAGRLFAALMPEDTVVCDETVSSGRAFFASSVAAAPHDWMQSCGAAIGCGLPLATGAAVGAPHRRIMALQADGSAMYTLQALWTQAREKLNVTTLLISNRKYQILFNEAAALGMQLGPTARGMLELSGPDLDWVGLAKGMGVEAARADTCEQLTDLMKQAFRREGPFLIELAV